MKINLNKTAVLQELAQRIKENQNGVREYLNAAGINTDNQDITLQHIDHLRQLNYDSFAELCRFLYPELNDKAQADGDNNNHWNADNYIGLIGTILGGASGILGQFNFNGNTSAQAQAQALTVIAAQQQAEQEKKQMRKTIAIVCIGFLVIVIAGVLIFKNRK